MRSGAHLPVTDRGALGAAHAQLHAMAPGLVPIRSPLRSGRAHKASSWLEQSHRISATTCETLGVG